MPNKMLIDATHPEETRVVVCRGKRVEEFDLESQERRQLRGNIYLAKVTRVEPSLQAAFVDYGGNRHGFLAFSEIHPDYYQIPVADRQALLEEVAAAEAAAGAEDAEEPEARDASGDDAPAEEPADTDEADTSDGGEVEAAPDGEAEAAAETDEDGDGAQAAAEESEDAGDAPKRRPRRRRRRAAAANAAEAPSVSEDADDRGQPGPADLVEQVGAEDALEEVPHRSDMRRRQYKIQEVIRRRQILLVQVVKEERGNKGAALTTYLSLAGRYCVLMPNTARGGGISRKITSPTDRRRLKSIASDLEVPQGTGVIVRTAGANRTKAEIKRDFEYLLRLWETIRELTLKSTAPSLIYEEGSLIKRSIRDLYNKEIEEILVEGEEGYKEAKAFMRMLMPSHARHVKQYKDNQPLFVLHRIESQLDQMFQPTVTLKSGGYLVINQTEALVAVDVNSGKSTREHNIEDTALNTNLEAAAEVARQLRLRDLAGLVVIDFIDMEEKRNNRAVERKIKECLKTDRARIQVGRISHFGLLEMSRQRIRASVIDGTMETCPSCQGSGRIRSISSTALQIVRALEEQAIASNRRNLTIRTNTAIALYMLNQKRAHIAEVENRFGIDIGVEIDETLLGSAFMIERGEPSEREAPAAGAAVQIDTVFDDSDSDDAPEAEAADSDGDSAEGDGEEATPSRRRRRRRGRKRGEETAAAETSEATASEDAGDNDGAPVSADGDGDDESAPSRPRRRRGRRGGRRQRRDSDAATETASDASAGDGGETETGADEATPADGEGVPGEPIDWPLQAASEDEPTEDAAPEESPVEAEAPDPADAADEIPLNGEAMVEAVAELPEAVEAEDEPAEETVAAETNGAGVEHVAETATADASEEEAETEARPRRRGWWQRRVSPE